MIGYINENADKLIAELGLLMLPDTVNDLRLPGNCSKMLTQFGQYFSD
jgi:hypothetical protein